MAFQIKDFASIAASIINVMRSTTRKITDFNVGSVARTLVEAPAAEMDELYQQMFIGLREAIPVSVYDSFDFGLIQAVPASGIIRVNITASTDPTLISAGTTFEPVGASVIFTSTADVSIEAGGTIANVPVVATEPGSVGNLAVGLEWTLSPEPEGFASATNLAALINGFDAETPDQRKLRFNAFIASLNRGTIAALEYGLSLTVLYDAGGNETERVRSTRVVEPWLDETGQPISLVLCYVHNGVGGTSGDLVNRAYEVVYGYIDGSGVAIPGWKAAGVRVDVFAATELVLDVAGVLTALPGYDAALLRVQAQQALGAYILGLQIGKPFQIASASEQVMAIEGVDNFVPADLAQPSAPVLGDVAGGALGAATYYAVTTYSSPAGETIASVEASRAVAGSRLPTVQSPAIKPGVTGWNVYIGTAPGALDRQNVGLLTLGVNFTLPVSGLITGDEPPAASTARLQDIPALRSEKFMPGTLSIT